jgi:hypothetical protein
VKLPRDARPLNEYARYYALDGQKIVGTYTRFVDLKNSFYDLPIGQRRWVDDYRSLPLISDGGCTVVNVLYDDSTGQIEQAACNGVA